tara:strand:+ start:43761 stop:45158 length:1398 start_codon:yes stop_codon:yes gene_type:complete
LLLNNYGERFLGLSVIILAAGKGTRMQSKQPKVLQLLAGKPLLGHVLSSVKNLEADDTCVVYGHEGKAVKSFFTTPSIRWAKQAKQLGTGHATQQAMINLPSDNRVLILAGDVPFISSNTLQRLLNETPSKDVSVLTVQMDDPTGYGRIIRNDEGIKSIVEHKDASENELLLKEINTGVMLCPGKNLKKWLNKLSNNNSKGEYYLTDVIKMAVIDGIKAHGIEADSCMEVMGINDKKQLAEAERLLQKKLVDELMINGVSFADPSRVDIRGSLKCGKDVFIDVNTVFEGDVHLGDDTKIGPNNVIRDSKIGESNIIHANCHIEGASSADECEIGPFARLRPGANLANKVKIGNFVEVKKSNIASGTKVNHLSYIGDAELGSDVNVGAGVITCNYDGAKKHKTIIKDNAFIGSNVSLVAPLDVGKNATVGAGSTISKRVPDGGLTVARSSQKSIKNWLRPKNKEAK